jgi:hypothetical protein
MVPLHKPCRRYLQKLEQKLEEEEEEIKPQTHNQND